MSEAPIRIIYRCRRCNLARRHDYAQDEAIPLKECPECGRMMSRDAIEATIALNVACTSQCTGASGPVCRCSCGGANHGSSWSF